MEKERPLRPFVKWAGGKKRILPQLLKLAPKNFGTYYEPFLGGGSMLLALRPKNAVVGDQNAQLVNAWIQIRDDPKGVLSILSTLDAWMPPGAAGEKYYKSLRDAYNEGIDTTFNLPQAALFIWLNKHCFNGLYRVSSNGRFNVPWNKKTGDSAVDPDNLRAVSKYLRQNNVRITSGDFRKLVQGAGAGDFIYLDPPYVPMGKGRDFTAYAPGGFTESDHAAVAETYANLHSKQALVMVSNSDTSQSKRLYDFPFTKIEDAGVIPRSVKASGKTLRAREIVFRNYT